MTSKKSTKSTIIFVLYNLLVVVILLALLEVTLGFLYRNPSKIPFFAKKSFSQYYSQYARNTIQVEPSCAHYDPDLFYLLNPGTCVFSNIEFSTPLQVNARGLRDAENALDKPTIIFLGDSFTMGWGAKQNESFPKLIESSGIKTLNAGISSFGTVREMALLKSFVVDSSQTIVLQYHANDESENTEYLTNNHKLVISSKGKYDSLCKVYESGKHYFPGKLTSRIGRLLLKDLILRNTKTERDFANEAKKFLTVLKDFDLSNFKKIIIFEIGSRNENSDDFINAIKNEITSGAFPEYMTNFILISLKSKFTPNDYFLLDDHLNSNGHQKLSTILLENL